MPLHFLCPFLNWIVSRFFAVELYEFLTTISLTKYMICKHFPRSVGCIIVLLIISSAMQKFLL